jgi:hypothetical protein
VKTMKNALRKRCRDLKIYLDKEQVYSAPNTRPTPLENKVKQPPIRRALLLIGAVAVLALSACANNSTIVHSYIDPTAKNMQLKGVLVIAVTQKMQARIEFEDAFVKALSQRGANAVASHTLLPSDKPTKENVIAAAKKANLDTILVSRYLGKNDQAIYHPGTIYYGVTPTYGTGYGSGFGGYYGRAYEVAYQQPVWTSNVTYTVNSDLFVTDTNEHLWQALSETIKAGGTSKLRDDVIKSFVGNMKRAGLFK